MSGKGDEEVHTNIEFHKLRRVMIVIDSGPGRYVTIAEKTYSYFAGNNYLGLSNHPDVKLAAISAIEKYGVNFAASRQTTGTSRLHTELEKCLAQFKNTESSLAYASGYMGDKMLMEALRDRYSDSICR